MWRSGGGGSDDRGGGGGKGEVQQELIRKLLGVGIINGLGVIIIIRRASSGVIGARIVGVINVGVINVRVINIGVINVGVIIGSGRTDGAGGSAPKSNVWWHNGGRSGPEIGRSGPESGRSTFSIGRTTSTVGRSTIW